MRDARLQPGELIGRSSLEAGHPDDAETTVSAIDRLRSGEADRVEYEKRFLRKDGNVLWAHVILAARRTILGLRTADGVVVYPTFQFDETNGVVSGLSEVLQCFRGADVDDWTLAGWLVSPLRVLGGRSVVDWLRSGRELEAVIVVARDAARRFSE